MAVLSGCASAPTDDVERDETGRPVCDKADLAVTVASLESGRHAFTIRVKQQGQAEWSRTSSVEGASGPKSEVSWTLSDRPIGPLTVHLESSGQSPSYAMTIECPESWVTAAFQHGKIYFQSGSPDYYG